MGRLLCSAHFFSKCTYLRSPSVLIYDTALTGRLSPGAPDSLAHRHAFYETFVLVLLCLLFFHQAHFATSCSIWVLFPTGSDLRYICILVSSCCLCFYSTGRAHTPTLHMTYSQLFFVTARTQHRRSCQRRDEPLTNAPDPTGHDTSPNLTTKHQIRNAPSAYAQDLYRAPLRRDDRSIRGDRLARNMAFSDLAAPRADPPHRHGILACCIVCRRLSSLRVRHSDLARHIVIHNIRLAKHGWPRRSGQLA